MAANRNITPPIDYSDSDDAELKIVKLDALVVMKIIKHCKENLPELVTGHLLGLDFNTTLEVTNCFPFPNRAEDDEEDADAESAEYQIEMMRCLREVNVDSNTVGWYQSTYMGSFVNESMIENQFNYQVIIKKCVVVIYDPLVTMTGMLSLKAFRLTNQFIHFYRNQSFTHFSLAKAGLGFNDIFEEIRIEIKNSHLLNACLYELDDSDLWSSSQQHSLQSPLSFSFSNPSSSSHSISPGWFGFDRLDLSTNPFLEKNLEFLLESSDDLANEQSKFQYYQRRFQSLLKKPGVSEEEIANFNTNNPPPSRLETLILSNQINNVCHQINNFAAQSVTKLQLVSGISKELSEQKQQGQQTKKP